MNGKAALSILFAFCLSTLLLAQPTSKGTRFWMAYMENITLQFNGEPTFGIWVYADEAFTGNIIVPQTGLVIPIEGTAGAQEFILPQATWYSEQSQVVANKGILIETDVAVNVSGIHYRTYFSDGTRLLPEELLGSSYTVLAVEDVGQSDESAFVIVATQDNTQIDITPTALTSELFPAGVTFSITLNEGQSYQVLAIDDLTGSTIVAPNGEAIAVFAGAKQGAVGCEGDDSHLWDQCLPIELWGTEYPLVSWLGQGQNEFKVLASEDDTQIFLDCEEEVILNAGESASFTLLNPASLKSTAPVQVAHLNRSSGCSPTENGPSFAIIHPLQNRSLGQSIYCSELVGPITQFFQSHSITLVGSAGNNTNVTLDGNVVNFTPFPNDQTLEYARIDLTPGTHEFVAPNGIWAETASLGDYDACTYALGFDIEVLDNEDVALFAQPDPATNRFCIGNPIPFSYDSDLSLSDPFWDFAGLGTSQENAPLFTFTEPGTYVVTFTANADGCPIEATITIVVEDCEDITGVEFFEDELLEIRWQPTGELQLLSKAAVNGQLSIYSSSGALIHTTRVVSGTFDQVGNLAPGLYLVEFSSTRGRVVERFIR